MIIFIWVVAGIGLLLWSLAAWGLHAVMGLDPSWLDDVGRLITQVPYGEVIDQWVPGWRELLGALLGLTQVALGWIGDWAPWLAWLLWAAGAALIVGTGGFLTLVVMLLRPKPTPATAAH